MKNYFLLLVIGVVMGWGYGTYYLHPKVELRSSSFIEETPLAGSFLPTLYPLEDRSFVLVMIGRNNGAYLESLFNSVFSQKYENFRVVYVDDASDDGSFQLASDLILNRSCLVKAEMIQNEKPLGILASLEKAVEGCFEDEIVVVVPTNGKLAHEWVLQRYNQYYANGDLWLTYGQYRYYPTYQMGKSKPYSAEEIDYKGFRSLDFRAFHLQSFYAALFKKIDRSDFLYEGQYVPVATEMAYMLPMMEMAAKHMQYIGDTLYLSYAPETEVDPFFAKQIASKGSYAPLDTLFSPYTERDPE
jgi:glycosyltransferase involved in cell wall biosynthesis